MKPTPWHRLLRTILLLSLALGQLWVPTALAEEPQSDLIELQVLTPSYVLDEAGVTVPEYGLSTIPGAPQLPVYGTLVPLPAHGDWKLAYRTAGDRLLAETVVIPAAPVPDLDLNTPEGWQDAEALPDSVPLIDRPDPAIYQADAFYPASPVITGEIVWQGGERLLPVRVFPFQYNPVTQRLRYHPDLRITVEIEPEPALAEPTAPFGRFGLQPDAPFAFSNGALRLRTGDHGLYRLTYQDLLDAGVPVGPGGEDPNTFAVWYLGDLVDVEISGAEDSTFDPGDLVVFYAIPYAGRYQNHNVYWFTYGGMPSPSMAARAVTPTGSEPVTSVITQTVHVEFNLNYRSTYNRPKDVDHWFDWQLYPNASVPTDTRSYDLDLDDPITTTGTVEIRALIHGGTNQANNPDQSVVIYLNGQQAGSGPFQWDGSTDYLATATLPATVLDSTTNEVVLEAALSQLPGILYYWISPDWVEVSYPARAEAENDHLYMEGVAAGPREVIATGFSSPDVQVYDVRDHRHPVRLSTTQVVANGGTYDLHFWDADLADPTYVAATEAGLLAPQAIEPDTPSQWAVPDHSYDYIAIVPSQLQYPEMTAALQPLLDHRTAEGFRVATVDVQDIYDEFSFGRLDPEAIRSFLAYAYHNWNQGEAPPQYALLVGDGHIDFRNDWGSLQPNLIPPYLEKVDPWLGEIPVDNRFVSLDGPDDFLPDMALGRIPARTAGQVTNVVGKILAYENEVTAPSGAWQQRVVYAAGSCTDSAGDFHYLSNQGRLHLPSAYEDSTIYVGDPAICAQSTHATGSLARAALREAYDDDAFMIQWFGHGNQLYYGTLSFQESDINLLAPNTEWPLVVEYTCVTGWFVNVTYGKDAVGEDLVSLRSNAGSIGNISPTGYHTGYALLYMQEGVTEAIFQHRLDRAGLAVNGAKAHFFTHSTGDYDVIDSTMLFGDPALKLRLPQGDLSTSTFTVDESSVLPGDPLHYTINVTNTSIYTVSHPLVVADYPESLAVVLDANGGADYGSALTWSLPDLPPASNHMLTFALGARVDLPPGNQDLTVEAAIGSQMAPTVTLSVNTSVLAAPDLAAAFQVDPGWVPPGQAVTYTFSLSNTGTASSTTTAVTMTLPAELGEPAWLAASSGTPVYQAAGHQVTWAGAVDVGATVELAFGSVVSPTVSACGTATVSAEFRDALGQTSSVAAGANLAVPDVNCSGTVDIADIQAVAGRWNLAAGNPGFHPRYDLDLDGEITALDISLVAQNWQ